MNELHWFLLVLGNRWLLKIMTPKSNICFLFKATRVSNSVSNTNLLWSKKNNRQKDRQTDRQTYAFPYNDLHCTGWITCIYNKIMFTHVVHLSNHSNLLTLQLLDGWRNLKVMFQIFCLPWFVKLKKKKRKKKKNNKIKKKNKKKTKK